MAGKATFQHNRHHAVFISSCDVSFIINMMKVLCLGTEELRHYCVPGVHAIRFARNFHWRITSGTAAQLAIAFVTRISSGLE